MEINKKKTPYRNPETDISLLKNPAWSGNIITGLDMKCMETELAKISRPPGGEAKFRK
jgi:hypothetical protein